jgi:hypothetical protein
VRGGTAVLFILISLAVICPGISATSPAVPADTRQAWIVNAGPELNASGTDMKNHSIPARYEVSPTLIDIRVEVSDTSLPGPKGEMAAGPRTIGFSADPVSLVILIFAIVAIAAGIWYVVRRKPEEVEGDGDEERQD